MSEENKNKKENKINSPFSGGKAPKGKRNKGNMVMYAIYCAILMVLGAVWFGGENAGGPKDITWNKLEPILLNQDQERIVVVNKEFAEIYIKKDVVAQDTTYKALASKNDAKPGFYKYQFVTFESFEKDIERVEEQIVMRDTMGRGDEIDALEMNRIKKEAYIELTPEKRTNAWREVLVMFGPFLLVIIFFVVMSRMSARQMGGGSGGGIFSVGKSKAKLYDGKTPTNVTFKDVAGLAGAKEEVMEVVDFLKNPKRYTDLGGKIPKGVLLVGPPGTGKTLLAKAVAGEANVPFFSMSGSDFVEMFVGVGASRVRDLFEEAKKKAPCIVFIDEIDAVGRARGRSGLSNANDERENTLNQLLTEMDGFGGNTGVIVLAATNRADVLDKALLRAGRFDRQIYVELPDLDERKAIFAVHMRKLKLSKDIDNEFLAKQTPGFSGADIANVCNEAALVAARKAKKEIEKQDFLDAIDRIIGGLEKRTKVLTEQEKRTIAYHESGHASVSWLLRWGDPLVKVTIVPRGKALGAAWYLPEERQITTKEQMFDSMTSLMAGRAAEEVVFGKVSTGALNDMERATKMAQSMVIYYGMSDKIGNVSFYDSTGQADWNFTKPFSEKTAEAIDNEVKALVEAAYAKAKELIVANREKLDELAATLFDREVIFKDDVERIYGARPWEPEKKVGGTDDKAEESAPAEDESPATASEEPMIESGAEENTSETATDTNEKE
ncbi:MAG: ATP-dependent zinc metalloprotease FtsH [Bacteroidales bacterium]|nr:ATP-dependent zinc metalloprotease FtsH [Bacteroidales bacterium]